MASAIFGWTLEPAGWAALLALTAMEIVLGVDNVVFLSLISARLPERQAGWARLVGLLLAFVFRVACLAGLAGLIAMTRPLLTVAGHAVSWRDLILGVAGLVLIAQATIELHRETEEDPEGEVRPAPRSFGLAVVNIAFMDLVFSIDSILTAIGMAKDLAVMVVAIALALLAMYVAAGSVAGFIRSHPTTKVLALSYLVLIGFSLVAEGSGVDVPRGYLYAAMGFSAGVEVLNTLIRRRKRALRAASGRAGPRR